MQFIDEVKIKVSSGKGGPGCASFRRESHVPRGGPDGGDGGSGGNVYFKVNPQKHSLLDFKYKKSYLAPNGASGGASNMTGSSGEDLVVEVPPGTVLRDIDGHIIADLQDTSKELMLLDGGRGGKGNHFFKTSINQAPLHAQKGEAGSEMEVNLELKLLADVGLLGFPNAGKSTLISRISAARPKVAAYPFTTLIPQLGVVKVDDWKNFVVADIPGIIPGAHKGTGLGIQFLKHIERTRIFAHIIDCAEGLNESLWDRYQSINYELEQYDNQNKNKEGFFPLSTRKQIVVFNKIDAVESEELAQWTLKFREKGVSVFSLSAVTGKNIQTFIYRLGEEVFKGDVENE